MRERKFRAWNQRFMQHQVVLHGPYAYLTVVDFQRGKMFRGPVMEFIGLKDKNGGEIYEGDIIKSSRRFHWTAAGTPMVVVWNNFVSGFRLLHPNYKWETSDNPHALEINQSRAKSVEVIGNIYENPKLLN